MTTEESLAATERAREADLLRTLETAPGHPERSFGSVTLGYEGESTVSGRMSSAGVLVGPDGRPAAGSLGVLTDDTMGFAVVAASTSLSWAVSIEITLDLLGPLLLDSDIRVRARGTDIDGQSGYATAEVRSAAGALVGYSHQHSRFVASPAEPAEPAQPGAAATPPSRPGSVLDLLGAEVEEHEDGSSLVIPDPDPWLNPLGMLHGGVAMCAVEAAATHATLDSPAPLYTSSFTMAFARPTPGRQPLTFRAQTLHRGRTLRVIEVVGLAGGVACTFGRVMRQAIRDEAGA